MAGSGGVHGMDVKPKAEVQRADHSWHELPNIGPIRPYCVCGAPHHVIKPTRSRLDRWLLAEAATEPSSTLTIPRGQIAMASGRAAADATEFELVATGAGDLWHLLRAIPAARLQDHRVPHQGDDQRRWHLEYDEDTVLQIHGTTNVPPPTQHPAQGGGTHLTRWRAAETRFRKLYAHLQQRTGCWPPRFCSCPLVARGCPMRGHRDPAVSGTVTVLTTAIALATEDWWYRPQTGLAHIQLHHHFALATGPTR